MIDSYKFFFEKLLKPLIDYYKGGISIENVRKSLLKINQFFFNSNPEIGQLKIDDLELETSFFSEFHKIWFDKAEEIIDPQIDIDKCKIAAEVLHNVKKQYNDLPFTHKISFKGLSTEDIATVRFLTANQDFRGSRETEYFFELYKDNPSSFDLQKIYRNPANFLSDIKITNLSQNDKREKYVKTTAKFLLSRNISAYDIADYYKNDVLEIKKNIVDTVGMGYGNKKTDMLIRDFYEWNIWKKLKGISDINVASDINTIKIALRTGILKTKLTPLISSFLDIFCYQYSIIDEWSSQAWRKVWEEWKNNYPETAPYGPAYMDYFLYNIIGKDFCNENLFEFKGEECNHKFYWHSGRNKFCLVCKDKYRNNKVTFKEINNKLFAICERNSDHFYEVKNRRSKKCKICEQTSIPTANIVKRFLPCTHDKGYIFMNSSKYVLSVLKGIKICPFEKLCKPKSENFIKLNPPKSISILGRTGWESAKTNISAGGGGLMS